MNARANRISPGNFAMNAFVVTSSIHIVMVCIHRVSENCELRPKNIKKLKFSFFQIFYSEIDRIRSELAKVEDMTNFTDNCRSADFGLSFLHVATMHGLTDFITELAEFGAKNLVDSVDRINQTPIFYGIAFGNLYKIGNLSQKYR